MLSRLRFVRRRVGSQIACSSSHSLEWFDGEWREGLATALQGMANHKYPGAGPAITVSSNLALREFPSDVRSSFEGVTPHRSLELMLWHQMRSGNTIDSNGLRLLKRTALGKHVPCMAVARDGLGRKEYLGDCEPRRSVVDVTLLRALK